MSWVLIAQWVQALPAERGEWQREEEQGVHSED